MVVKMVRRITRSRLFEGCLSCRLFCLLLSIIGQSRQTTNNKKTCCVTFIHQEDERWAYCSRHGYIGPGRLIDD
jgi:hypothetical protein